MSTTTMSSGAARRATRMAAATAMPPEPPTSTPSTSDTRRAIRKLSSSLIGITSSYSVGLPGGGEEVLADALDEVGPARPAGEHRALGVGGDDPHGGVLRLEVAGDAGDRAARAGPGDEVGDPPVGLAPDLGPGGQLVGPRVRRVGVLVGPERRQLAGQAFGHRVVALRVVGLDGHRAHHHLGAVGPEQRDLLRCHLVGHHEHAAVAALGGDDGETDAGVPARRLDDGAARSQRPVALGLQDHLQRRPVLRRPAGVGGLQLHGEHARQGLDLAQAPQAHERRVADQIDHRRGDLGAFETTVSHGQEATHAPRPSRPPSVLKSEVHRNGASGSGERSARLSDGRRPTRRRERRGVPDGRAGDRRRLAPADGAAGRRRARRSAPRPLRRRLAPTRRPRRRRRDRRSGGRGVVALLRRRRTRLRLRRRAHPGDQHRGRGAGPWRRHRVPAARPR